MKLRGKIVLTGIVLALLLGVFTFGNLALAAEREQQSQFAAPIMVVNTSFLNVRTGPGTQYTVLVTVVGGTELPVLGVFRDRVWYQVSTIAGVGWINSQYALPRGDFRNVPFVEAPQVTGTVVPGTTASDEGTPIAGFTTGREWGVSVVISHPQRAQPTINSSSLGTLNADLTVIYTVLEAASGDGIVWYRVRTSLGIGWVEGPKVIFRPFACTLTAVIMNTAVTPGIGPDGSGTLTGNVTVPQGTEAYLLDAIGSMYKIELLDGNVGWVPSSVVTVREGVRSEYCETGGARPVTTTTTGSATPGASTQAQFTNPHVVINTGFLNIRSGPGVQFTVVATVPGGTRLEVIGVAPDRVWYLVQGTFGQGWLNSEFVLFRGDGRRLPIIRNVVGTLAQPVATITNAVTLYAAPNPGSAVIGVISGPVEANIVARNLDASWVQLNTALGFGWVLSSQVAIRGDISLAPVVGG